MTKNNIIDHDLSNRAYLNVSDRDEIIERLRRIKKLLDNFGLKRSNEEIAADLIKSYTRFSTERLRKGELTKEQVAVEIAGYEKYIPVLVEGFLK